MQTAVKSTKNKEMLWAMLQESGAFGGFTQSMFDPVKQAFENIIEDASHMKEPLGEVNKFVIREFMKSISSISQPPPKQNMQLIYRADDIKNSRSEELNRRFKETETEMNSYLKLKKPDEVNFKDTLTNDKPIVSGEMSLLIAKELATRERELVQLNVAEIKRAEEWIGTKNQTQTNKKVSFQEEEMESNPIVSKFKILEDTSDKNISSVASTYDDLKTLILSLHETIVNIEIKMTKNHEEMIELIKNSNFNP